MARINSFRDLQVWQLAMELVLECYQLTGRLPAEERFGLIAQARRCAVSIPSNIAEGHNRHARNVFLQHVNIALGSAAELDTQIEIGVRLGYLTSADAGAFIQKLGRIGQMLRRLQQSLASASPPKA
jgi:four helix bundle protein